MAEVAKPDYLSLVNKGGSGFNVSELVTSIVASEIEPKRSIQASKQEKTEASISGIGYLSSQATASKAKFDGIIQDKFFTVTSSNTSGVSLKATDETKLSAGTRSISDVTIAKKMIFEFGGFANITDPLNANLTIDFGTWVQSDLAAAATGYAAGKTYKVTSDITVNSDINKLRNDTTWGGAANTTIPAGTIIKVDAGKNDNLSVPYLQNLDIYTFTDADVANSETVNFTGENLKLNQVASRLNSITGISAKVVDTKGDQTDYSLVVTSDETGLKNGFRITGDDRWLTPTVAEGHANNNKFNQLASNANFKLDGVSVTRTKNTIDDLIDGVEVELKSNFSSAATITTARSESSVKTSVNNLISSLNEFKAEIDRLTFIDVEGDKNGALVMDPSVTALKSNFKKLSLTPLTGYGESGIYLSQLGIKTNTNGEYFLDERTFNKTLSSNPGAFSAIKDASISTNDNSITASKPDYTTIDPAIYDITAKLDGSYTIKKSGTTDSEVTLLQLPRSAGGVTFTSTKFPGLKIESSSATPSSFKLYVGESFSKKVSDLMAGILDMNSSVNKAKQGYETIKEDIAERLSKLETREKLITTQYTERFGEMEKSMTQFNSTKTLLENFVEAWKKQK